MVLNLLRNKKRFVAKPPVNTAKIKEESYESLAKTALKFLDMDYVLKLINA